MDKIMKKAKYWLSEAFDADTRKKTEELIENDPQGLEDSFYRDLAFGTGGMRGIMGVGTNRINKYTLGKNSQGISNYLKAQFPSEDVLKVAIAYDCRHNSKELAQVVADVFSANGLRVYLFSELRPTPELSFAVRHLQCHCGIVLTASHNPPEYNGFKVYWQDGGQLVPPQDEEIIEAIAKVDYENIQFAPSPDLITKIDEEVDEAFLEEAIKNTSFGVSAQARENLTVVYTPLHGTSVELLPRAFEKAGFSRVYMVKEQARPDGNFPTVESPNPEEPAALQMALELAEEKNADIVVGTDPDSDRLGVAVRDLKGKLVLLNGNQTMVTMTDFLLKNYQKEGLKGNELIASTVVSTPLMTKLAGDYGVESQMVLTGFKWIAKMIRDNPDKQFIGGGEESFGFMVGDFVRDKDAVSSVLLACELAARAKAEKSSFYREMIKVYKDHGFYQERMTALVKKGIDGAQEIDTMMRGLRENPPKAFDGIRVEVFEDYAQSVSANLKTGTRSKLEMPKSNVLIFYLEDGSKICARPSGTEPKIKFYISVKGELDAVEDFPRAQRGLDKKIDGLLSSFDF